MNRLHRQLDKLEAQILASGAKPIPDRTPLSFQDTLQRVAEEYTGGEKCEQRDPELYRDLEEAYWRENPYDVTEAIVDIEKKMALAFNDWHELGRVVGEAMSVYIRAQLDRAIWLAHEEYMIRIGERG